MTSYVILAQDASGYWTRAEKTVEARSAEDAVRQGVTDAKPDSEPRLFVAIPARSWKPYKVDVQTETKVTLEMWGAS